MGAKRTERAVWLNEPEEKRNGLKTEGSPEEQIVADSQQKKAEKNPEVFRVCLFYRVTESFR
jgi:hypothetical protein